MGDRFRRIFANKSFIGLATAGSAMALAAPSAGGECSLTCEPGSDCEELALIWTESRDQTDVDGQRFEASLFEAGAVLDTIKIAGNDIEIRASQRLIRLKGKQRQGAIVATEGPNVGLTLFDMSGRDTDTVTPRKNRQLASGPCEGLF